MFFFFNQKTAYEMLIIDWSSDVCSSDLEVGEDLRLAQGLGGAVGGVAAPCLDRRHVAPERDRDVFARGAQTLEPLDRQKPVHLLQRRSQTGSEDRKSVVEGKSVSVRVDPGGHRIIKKKTKKKQTRL